MFLLQHQKHYHYYNIGVALFSLPIGGEHIANVHYNSFLSGAKTEWASRPEHDRRVNIAYAGLRFDDTLTQLFRRKKIRKNVIILLYC